MHTRTSARIDIVGDVIVECKRGAEKRGAEFAPSQIRVSIEWLESGVRKRELVSGKNINENINLHKL